MPPPPWTQLYDFITGKRLVITLYIKYCVLSAFPLSSNLHIFNFIISNIGNRLKPQKSDILKLLNFSQYWTLKEVFSRFEIGESRLSVLCFPNYFVLNFKLLYSKLKGTVSLNSPWPSIEIWKFPIHNAVPLKS